MTAAAARQSVHQVPTASGYGRHRSVDLPEASAHLEWVVTAITEAAQDRRVCRPPGHPLATDGEGFVTIVDVDARPLLRSAGA